MSVTVMLSKALAYREDANGDFGTVHGADDPDDVSHFLLIELALLPLPACRTLSIAEVGRYLLGICSQEAGEG
jgi:hypothetical protein